MTKRHFCIFSTILICVIFATHAVAQISPGKLSKYHKDIEGINNCTQCHELGEEVVNSKCLTCHTVIETRINQNKGYHSSAEVKTEKCATCHSEHHGLEYELVYWKNGQNKFDHQLTGWPLLGAHLKQNCQACHNTAFIKATDVKLANNTNKTRTLLGNSTDCKSCHEDEHHGQLNENCLSCHNYEAWAPAEKFSHKDTKYPLTGKHAQVVCLKCHQNDPAPAIENKFLIQKKERLGMFAKYSRLNFSNCIPCHADVHEGKFSSNCKSCHTTDGFDKIVGNKFDHTKTNYPLIGKHAGVECTSCHISGTMTDPLAHQFCVDCHKDMHRGQFADRLDKGACENCHTVNGFIPAVFDMEAHNKSRYPLTGSHLAVPCLVCHTQIKNEKSGSFARFDFSDMSCKGCHADVHRGQLDKWIQQSGCEYCHSTDTWHETKFDHSLTKFPLSGKHSETKCISCHKPELMSDGNTALQMKSPLECNACHEDPHMGQFVRSELFETKTTCERCHTPKGWTDLLFVHNRDAKYHIDGAHEKVACIECHKAVASSEKHFIKYKPLGMECIDCHGNNIK